MELMRFPSSRGYSVRSIIAFVLTVITAALLWTTFLSTPTYAAGEATWQAGSTILFDNHGYNRDSNFKDPTGTIPADSTVYKSAIQNNTQSTGTQRVFVLYFSPGVDPPTATSVNYVEFDYKNDTVSNPQNAQVVTALPQKDNGDSGTSCSVTGIGWVICPVSEFLADAMDNMFNILAGMIAVRPPVIGDTNNSMYVAWNIMRTIANVAFVIAFLIIIYSQLTNMGVSNYGLKKLIPRLVVAAVLVNVSYIVTALSIDVSNILGFSVQNFFNIIREQTFHLTNDNVSGLNTNTWGAVTAAILAGGGIVAGAQYAAAGGLYMLVPLLIGLALTLIFVIIILAARQAIIVILVIIAPLAFVANLLPNTEKWFNKWKDTFMTMLIFFPAFSLVFGGSQLAGQIIIQNASDNIVMLLFGMAVQVAPLVITPLILKLSGGLLGKVAQIANNPRKGVMDRSKNWAERRGEHAKQRNIKQGARWYNPASYGSGLVRRSDFKKRKLQDSTDAWKQEATNRYEQTDDYAKIHERKTAADLDKSSIHDNHAAHIEKLKQKQGTRIHDSAINAQVSKEKLEARQKDTGAYYNRQSTLAGTALNASTLDMENSKMLFDSSDQSKQAYLNKESITPGTRLNDSMFKLEDARNINKTSENEKATFISNQNIRPNSRLNDSFVNMEASKTENEAAQQNMAGYLDVQRTNRGSRLGAAAERLAVSTNNAEGHKGEFNSHINELKISGGNQQLKEATRFAATSKERLEAAELNVQKVFDYERSTLGTALHKSTIELERVKDSAGQAKNTLTKTITSEKLVGGRLHNQYMANESSKIASQKEEATLTRVVEEYRAGGEKTDNGDVRINGKVISSAQRAVSGQMLEDSIYISAEKQGASAAQYELQRKITDSMTGQKGAHVPADVLLDIAQSVGGDTARVRAQAQAVSTKNKLDNDALNANVELLKAQAAAKGETSKKFTADIVTDFLEGADYDQTGAKITDERLKAALQAQAADEKNISLFEKVRGSARFNQDMVSSIIAMNAGAFKGAGGFHLQNDPGLNINNIGSKEEYEKELGYARIQSLANAGADGLSGVKFGWLATFTNTDPKKGLTWEDNINAALSHDDGEKFLGAIYDNMKLALNTPETLAELGDRLDEVRFIETKLAELFDEKPTEYNPHRVKNQ